MAFFTLENYMTKVVRSPGVDPVANPQPIRKGTIVLASDLKTIGVVTTTGHLGGDNFEVQYTAGSNLVIIPNNILVWSGLKLFSPQFPAGVAITSKTANFREYTIASNATVTRKEFSNFCYIRSGVMADFGNYNLRAVPAGADMNLIRNEGSYYVVTATSNLAETGTGHFVDVVQQGSSIIQISRANNTNQRVYHRRSTDAGLTWSAWFEVLTTHALTWVNGTLQNGFTVNSGLTPQFSKQGNLGYLKGQVIPPGTYGDSFTVLTIPTAYIPAETQYGSAMGIGTGSSSLPVNRLRVSATGIVTLAHNLAVGAWDLSMVYRLN